jgi:hypothetical protein
LRENDFDFKDRKFNALFQSLGVNSPPLAAFRLKDRLIPRPLAAGIFIEVEPYLVLRKPAATGECNRFR